MSETGMQTAGQVVEWTRTGAQGPSAPGQRQCRQAGQLILSVLSCPLCTGGLLLLWTSQTCIERGWGGPLATAGVPCRLA